MAQDKEHKSVLHIILSRILGLAVFLAIVFLLGFLQNYIHDSLYYQTVNFLYENILPLIIISVVYTIGEIFGALGFPLNLPGPLFSAVATYLLAGFLLQLLSFLGRITDEPILYSLNPYKDKIMMAAFIFIFVMGYGLIFLRIFTGKK